MLPAGNAARPLDLVDINGLLDGPDVDRAYAVVCAADIGVLGTAERSREAIRANLTNPDARVGEHRLVLTGEREPVGMCVMDDSHADRGASHVEMLGVIPQARGRGIASWLLRSAFATAANEGRTSVTLTVDADNTTGATALYEGVGMRAEQVRVHYRRPLASSRDGEAASDSH